jgi:Na+/citrate or Na+/malate symporter
MVQNSAVKEFKIMGMSLPYFIVLAIIVIGSSYMGYLPGGMAGIIPYMMIMGAVLRIIGDNIPIVKDYLGGGSMVVLFGSSALVYFGLIPEKIVTQASDFLMGGGFINLALAALIIGSIFGMSRKLLSRAIVLYLPCIFGGLIVALLLVGAVGAVIGYGFKDAILYIGIPIMGGGTSAGAVPLSQMYAGILERDAGEMLSIMTPAVGLGNAVAIIAGGLLNKIGKTKPSLSGNGNLVKSKDVSLAVDKAKADKPVDDLSKFGIGIAVSILFLIVGTFIQKLLFPQIHAYAWMVIVGVLVKISGIIPEDIEESAHLWYMFVVKNFTQLLLVVLGLALIDIGAVFAAISIQYLILVIVTIFGAVIGSGLVGQLVGFYFVESSITAGLCMANMGGSGDIATLGAADRMELMPFAAVSSRLGGSIVLIIAGFLLQFFV